MLGPTYERENEANSLKLHSVCPASVFQCAHRNQKKTANDEWQKNYKQQQQFGKGITAKKSGKERHKSVNDHEQQTNLLRADCKFVDIH